MEHGVLGRSGCRWSALAWATMNHSTPTPKHPLLACMDAIEKALAATGDSDPLYLDAAEKAEFLVRSTRLISQQEARRLRAVATAGDVAADHGLPHRRGLARTPHRHRPAGGVRAGEASAPRPGRAVAPGRRRARRRAGAPGPGPGHRQGPRRPPRRRDRRGQAAGRAAAGRARRAVRTHRPGPPRPADPRRDRPGGRRRTGTPGARTRRGQGRSGDPAGLQAPRATGPPTSPPPCPTRPRPGSRPTSRPSPPRATTSGDGDGLDPPPAYACPRDRQRGQAFCALLERLDPTQLPDHGGLATTLMVTMPLDDPAAGLGTAQLGTGETITAGEARRLACTAGLVPAVLGSEVRGPRPRPHRPALHPGTAQGACPEDTRSAAPRHCDDPRTLVRSPPRHPLEPRRQDRPQRRPPALPLAPQTRPRPPLPHRTTAQRRAPIPPTELSRSSSIQATIEANLE